MFFLKKPESFIGVDLGAGGVKIVELKKEKNRPVLYTYGLMGGSQDIHRVLEKKELSAEELIGNKLLKPGEKKAPDNSGFFVDEVQVEKFSKMLKATCESSKVVSRTAVASLPVSSVFHAVVTLPVVKKEDFDRILKAEIKKLLPYPIEQMAYEHEIIHEEGENQKEQRVLVNATPRALVAFYTQIFKNAGLKLESLEPESMALTRALIGRDTATTMLIDIGAERTNFFIIEKAFPITHHSIEIGGDKINQIVANILGVELPVGAQVKEDLFSHMLEGNKNNFLKKDNFLAIFSSVLDPVLKEIEYSLELFLRQSGNQGKRPEKIVLSGGSAIFPYLADAISEKFKLKCYIGDPFGRVVYQDGLKPVLRKIAPRMSVAIGLALRNVV